nr:pyridoxal phosphate-dependent aminotransferase family protein [Flavobacteriaceae bacterium]
AFVACNEEVCNFLRYTMRSQIFAKSLPMPIVAGSLKRLELLRSNPDLQGNLWKIAKALQNGLKEAGLNIGKCSKM